MYMNSAPHLLCEDRPEFERILDEALRTAPHGPEPAAGASRPTAEQLRATAMGAVAAIAACAAEEYQQFVRLREELRADADVRDELPARRPTAQGAGLAAVVSALAPVLAGVAAVIFLLLGYTLRLLTPEPGLAAPMRSVGWVFAVLAAAGGLVGMMTMLLMAHRNGGEPGGRSAPLAEEVERAHQVWSEALLERGILPFLDESVAARGTGAEAPAFRTRAPSEPRTARLGYSGPSFANPDFSSSPATESAEGEERSVGPRFSSPDFSGPEYGGPENP